MIRIATVKLKGIAPMSQSKHYEVPKIGKETPADYEKRTWRNRMHFDENGLVYIPQMALKNTLQGAASHLGEKVKGRGAKTFSQFFKNSVLVMDVLETGINYMDVPGYELFVPSKPGMAGGSRVMKTFGRIDNWKGIAKYFVFDETVTNDVFERHIVAAGQFVGLGMFRPERGGYFGRFAVENIDWSTQDQV